MRRRENSQVRRSTNRDSRTILIFCGASRTEYDYLEGMRAALRPPCVIKVRANPVDPTKLVQGAVAYRDRYPGTFDETWVVFDVDHFEREGGKVTTAVVAAKRSGVNVAVSNPCFEFFLLLHHEKCDAPFTNCAQILTRLKQNLPRYDKTRLRFTDFAPGVADALARARNLDPSAEDFRRNPSTGVWRLVEQITENR